MIVRLPRRKSGLPISFSRFCICLDRLGCAIYRYFAAFVTLFSCATARKYFYGKTTAEIQKKIQEYLNSAPTPKRKKRTADTTPLFEIYAAQWIEQYKKTNLKPKSLESLNFALKKAVDAFSGKTIGSITTDNLQRFFTSLPPSRSRDLCAVYVGQLFKKFVTGVIKKNLYEQVEIKNTPRKNGAR